MIKILYGRAKLQKSQEAKEDEKKNIDRAYFVTIDLITNRVSCCVNEIQKKEKILIRITQIESIEATRHLNSVK